MFADNKFACYRMPERTIFAAKFCRSYAFYCNFDGVCVWFFLLVSVFHAFCAFIRNIFLKCTFIHTITLSLSLATIQLTITYVHTHTLTHPFCQLYFCRTHMAYVIPCQKWKMLIIWTTRFMALYGCTQRHHQNKMLFFLSFRRRKHLVCWWP